MKKIGVVLIWLALAALPATAGDATRPVQFQANEAESLLVLFNRTIVSGGDVELIAGLGAKLNAARIAPRQLAASEQPVSLTLTPEEIRYCLAVIRNSTFQAKYAGLVLGVKAKLMQTLEETSTGVATEKQGERK